VLCAFTGYGSFRALDFTKHGVGGDARALICDIMRQLLQLHSCRHAKNYDTQAAASVNAARIVSGTQKFD